MSYYLQVEAIYLSSPWGAPLPTRTVQLLVFIADLDQEWKQNKSILTV